MLQMLHLKQAVLGPGRRKALSLSHPSSNLTFKQSFQRKFIQPLRLIKWRENKIISKCIPNFTAIAYRLGFPVRYKGVHVTTCKGRREIHVIVRSLYICCVQSRDEGKRIFDLYTTILRDQGLVPADLVTNWETLGEKRPIDADDKEKIEKVLKWYERSHVPSKKSVYKGVTLHKGNLVKGRKKYFHVKYQNCKGVLVTGGCYDHELDAALAYDKVIRESVGFNKVEKLKLLNFRTEKDYLTRKEAIELDGNLIGVERVEMDNQTTAMKGDKEEGKEKGKVRYKAKQTYDRNYAILDLIRDCPIKAAILHDEHVFKIWTGKRLKNALYPATNFSPLKYGYVLQDEPPMVELD